jgi:hypothetical protein
MTLIGKTASTLTNNMQNENTDYKTGDRFLTVKGEKVMAKKKKDIEAFKALSDLYWAQAPIQQYQAEPDARFD